MAKIHSTPIQLPLPVEGETVEIPLTKGYVTIVDAVDADLICLKWCANINKSGEVYADRIERRGTGKIHKKLHIIILERAISKPIEKGMFVDHVNGNTLDNRRANLRAATPRESQQNTGLRANNKSGLKGAWYSRAVGKWRSCIRVNGKPVELGFFDTAQEAHDTYCAAAVEHFGEFARFE